jgi:hypothetical protein
MKFYHVIELSALVLGVTVLSTARKCYTFYAKSLIIYIVLAFFFDYGGEIIFRYNISPNNGWLFNLYDIIKYPLLFYLFFLTGYFKKKKIVTLVCICLIALIMDGFSIISFNSFLSFYTIFADLLLIYLSLDYYYRILKTPEHKSLLVQPFFWFANGILFYFLCVLPYHVLWTPMASQQIDYDRRFYEVIFNIAIFLHYSCFSISMWLCKYPKSK